jgi:hypothetical protein
VDEPLARAVPQAGRSHEPRVESEYRRHPSCEFILADRFFTNDIENSGNITIQASRAEPGAASFTDNGQKMDIHKTRQRLPLLQFSEDPPDEVRLVPATASVEI